MKLLSLFLAVLLSGAMAEASINGGASFPPSGGGGAEAFTLDYDSPYQMLQASAAGSTIVFTDAYAENAGGLYFAIGDNVSTLSIADFTDALGNQIDLYNGVNVTALELPAPYATGGFYGGISFNGCALGASTVDGFLNFAADCYTLGSASGGSIDLSGGTNATPTSASSSAVSTLIAYGCTVTTN